MCQLKRWLSSGGRLGKVMPACRSDQQADVCDALDFLPRLLIVGFLPCRNWRSICSGSCV